MRVLLDTHALIWALTDPSRLSADAAALLRDRDVDIVVSAATAWEIATKVRIGKLPAAQRLADSYADSLDRLGASGLPIFPRHALLAGSMHWEHGDPFDRMLAAQSLLEDLPLLSADGAFAGLAGLRVRW